MIKVMKKFIWIFVITAQILSGTALGMIYLSAIEIGSISANITADGLSLKDMTYIEAAEAIDGHFSEQFKNSKLTIEVGGQIFSIPYSDFDVSIDRNKTIEELKKVVPNDGISMLFLSPAKEVAFNPVITFNSGKLQRECESIFSQFVQEPIPEKYSVEDSALLYFPQVPGKKVDYSLLENEILNYLNSFAGDHLKIDPENSPIFAEVTSGESKEENFTIIVSKAEIPFDIELTDKLAKNIEKLNGAVFKNGEDIALGSILDFSQFSDNVEKDALNRIASGVYQSLLSIEGIKTVKRIPSRQPVSFTEAGLEAVIEGENPDLVMKNETNASLMLLTKIEDKAATFFVISPKELKSGILIVQKTDELPPPVITSVNNNLPGNKTKVVSEGVPGFTASVSRIIDNDRVELYRDKYDPISRVIETGIKPDISGDK